MKICTLNKISHNLNQIFLSYLQIKQNDLKNREFTLVARSKVNYQKTNNQSKIWFLFFFFFFSN